VHFVLDADERITFAEGIEPVIQFKYQAHRVLRFGRCLEMPCGFAVQVFLVDDLQPQAGNVADFRKARCKLKVFARLRSERRLSRGLFGGRFGWLASRGRAGMFRWGSFGRLRRMGDRRESHNWLLAAASKMQPQKSAARE